MIRIRPLSDVGVDGSRGTVMENVRVADRGGRLGRNVNPPTGTRPLFTAYPELLRAGRIAEQPGFLRAAPPLHNKTFCIQPGAPPEHSGR